ncbi:hypothetical protein FH966_09990 [Lentibacillus cibarius]|uniref:Lipoprotein n=1 Tax=Lentibacillus cibarius TaxID=2583219 RepID=A0A549YJD8_9BACI|nr:hypothetical protein [Lentibacillus cibarius]TRM11989.1 hypothetical protein FH966_09990 [Lentibacillus cibarius]
MKRNSFIFVITSLLVLLITGCEMEELSKEKEQIQRNSFNGYSKYWSLNEYELKIEDNEIFAGNGELQYKAEGNITDYISFKMIAVINDEKVELQGMKNVSSVSNFNNIETGSATQEIPMIKGEEIRLTDIDDYYGIIEWMSSEGKRKSEKINTF